jgi:hypothetical protein
MAKQKQSEIDEELKKEEAFNYGEQEIGGTETSLEADDDAEEGLEKYTGQDLNWNDKRDLGDIIEESEKQLAGLSDDSSL